MTIKVTKLGGTTPDPARPGAGEGSEIDNLDALPPEMTRLLDEPIYATVATLRRSGPPHVTVVFCDRDADYVYINSSKGRIKDINLRARPEITLHVKSLTNERHWMSVEGKVVEIIDEEDPERAAEVTQHIDDLAEFYVKMRPYPFRFPGEVRVRYKIEPSRLVCFGPIGDL